MNFRRRQLLGWSILALCAVLGGAWLLRLDYRQKISTDVLDLIPARERSPELALVRELASEAEARTMLFVLTQADGRPAPAEAAAALAAELKKDPVFAQALAMGDSASRDAVGHELYERRLALLFPLWLEDRRQAFDRAPHGTASFSEWLATDTATRLNQFLATPAAVAFQDLIPSDPLLLMPWAVDRLKPGLALVQPATGPAKQAPALVWAQLAVSPLTEAGQQPAFAAIERAVATVRQRFAGVEVRYTGVNCFAAASRHRIEAEVSRLNLLSVVAVFAVAFLFIRGVHRAFHLVPVVLLAVLGAWVVATASFDRLHILVFVVGSLLTGVAIDYGFYLYMQPPATPDEDYWRKVRRLIKPLLASCFTTVAGFALLVFSELPVIRQLGVFVGAGLVCALAGAIVYFSTVRDPYLEARSFRHIGALPSGARRGLRYATIALWVAALGGLFRLSWRDDIRDLEVPSPEVQRTDAAVRAEFGGAAEHSIYLTYADSVADARERVETLDAWLHRHGATFANLATIVPTAAEADAAAEFVRQHPDFAERLKAALGGAGFEADGFEPFFTAYAEYASHANPALVAEAVTSLQSHLTGPLALLLHTGRGMNWFVTLVDRPIAEAPPSSSIAANQLESLNAVFGRYRQSALRLSAIGLAIVGLGVLLTYGVRDGVRIFAIPCGACLGVFGVFGWTGMPLNLFHLLGAFLGVCLTHNYSIFTATSAYRHEPPPVSVRLSALTAAASFGVLALSGIPVVRALGSTVAAMVIAALLAIELEHLQPLGRKADEGGGNHAGER